MITVIIPTLQKNKSILDKLIDILSKDSIVEKIIVIDNSLKGYNHTSEKVLSILPKQNLYVNPSWNYGVSFVKTKYFALFNDDLLVCENFCSSVLNRIKNDDKFGFCGMSTDCVFNKDAINIPPQSTPEIQLNNGDRPFNWGVIIFGKTDDYIPVPDNLKILCGDDFYRFCAQQHNKALYDITNTQVYHLGSLSSSDEEFRKQLYSDCMNFGIINKEFKKTFSYKDAFKHTKLGKFVEFMQKVLLITNSENKKHKVITILGIKIKLKTRKHL